MGERRCGRLFWVYLAVAALIVGWIGVRTQITADRQEREARQAVLFADQTRDCLQQLVDTLIARAAITDAADRANNDQHRVLKDMIAAVSTAPAERKDETLDQYLPAIADAQRRQEALIDDRAQHPLPDPSCPA